MDPFILVLLSLIPLGIMVYIWIKTTFYLRTQHILKYPFPQPLKAKVKSAYPHLSNNEVEFVFEALREYFLMCRQTSLISIAMPSKVVDTAWHEMILSTRTYHEFCKKSFGRYLHHQPGWESPSKNVQKFQNQKSWGIICQFGQINPAYPATIPLLFQIDEQLNIQDGFFYQYRPEKNAIYVKDCSRSQHAPWKLYCRLPVLENHSDGGDGGDDNGSKSNSDDRDEIRHTGSHGGNASGSDTSSSGSSSDYGSSSCSGGSSCSSSSCSGGGSSCSS
ncbi:hypothetical protein [Photobacterium sp. 1_MG-2023]|uniref:glycine-rich domain-containing protein n=1 Tax=Photobacterium sp. 1_MG-2023 TaxID=3062646 RepID=UPI0026E46249|nr:hypothetical protein [Photobacterium sp. 1_MG-2023]MDO6707532.1 hypothetical protein [Photobacterium sp. 1_MG-2023]